ncbi:MAG: acylase [Gemmatimonadota bacterium]
MTVRTVRRPVLLAAALLLASAAQAPAQNPRAAQAGQGSEILWDRWGVPHVFARSDRDLGWGFGWAQAHSHGDRVLTLYGLARGRGAEYWGERYLASDRLVRTVGIPEQGARDLAAQPAELRRYLQAFADGFNAYARAHPERIADSVEAVLPVTAADLLRHSHRVMFSFVSVTGNQPPMVGLNGLPPERRPGSNGWAVAPSRAAGGHAMLLQNPHLSWDDDLQLFYEAQLSGPGSDVYGVTLVGFPVIVIGFNDRLGWTHTVNTIDALDTYRLTPSGDGYRFDGGVRSFQVSRQTLRVKGADGRLREEELVVRRSVHGPVVRMDDTSAVALRTTSLEAGGLARQFREMGRARGLAEFEAALRRMQLPMFNVVYADRDGHVLYLFGGRVPRRPSGDFASWQGAVRGDTSATLWSGILGYDELPRIVDPASGFVQNSNSPPWFATLPSPLDPARFPAYLAPRSLNFREQRGLAMLAADSSITFDELLAMRWSNRMLLADRVLDELIPAARASGLPLAARAAEVLERWDRTADAESRGAVLFAAWAREARPTAGGRGFARRWDPAAPLATPSGLADLGAAAAALARAAERVERAYGALDVPWGQVNRLSRDLPGNGASGDPLGVFHVVDYAPTEGGDTLYAVAGDTYVGAVEFTPGGPRAQTLLSYGNATQPGSPHVRDQLPLLARREMRPVWRTRAEVEANLEERTPIRP